MKTKNFLIMLLLALMMPVLAMAQNCTITVSQDGGYTAPLSTISYNRGGGNSGYIRTNPQTITCNQGESFSLSIPCSGDYAPTQVTISYGNETQVVTLTPRLDQSAGTAFTVPSTSTASVTIHWTPIVAKNVNVGDFTYSLLYYDSSITPSRQAIVKTYNGTLTSFRTSESITYSGNTYTVVSVEQNAFKNNTSISLLRLPSSIREIPSTMMQGCTNLKSCVIDGPITEIPFKAFDGCTSLNSSTSILSSNLFTVPATVTTIGGEAFMNCTSLKTVAIYTPVRAIAGSAFNGCSDDLLIRFQPSGSNTTLGTGSKLFSDYCGVHKMEVMSGITAIGDQAFAGCNALTNFTLTSDVQTLGNNVFNGSVQDLSVTINKGTSAGQINSYLFQNVSNVKSLTIGSGITQILAYAFNNCTNLTTVSLPSTLTTIAFQAFYGCPNITNLVIPSSVQNIYNQAFYDYTGPVNIPSSVTTIESGAFFNATNVTVNWETPLTLSSNPFSSALQANATLHVPTGTVDAYRAANYWKNFGTITDGTTTSKLDYAVLSTDGKTLTFYHDSNQANSQGTVYSLNTGSANPGWYGQCASVESVVFNSSFASARPTSTFRWFSGMSNLTSITGLSNLNTSEVTNMGSMFYNCSKLTNLNLNLSGFNTSKVTNMAFMFQKCSGLTSLNVAGFNTANVTNMTAMFDQCSSLTSLDLSGFNTAKVTTMAQMFYGCSKLTSLDLSSFNTANVVDMSLMFCTCYALTSLDISSFRTPKVTSMSYMFNNCRALTSLDVSKFSTVNVTSMNQMFTSCWNLTELDVSRFTTIKVTNMSAMFSSCRNLTTIDVSGFITENVTNMKEMFSYCLNLKLLDLHKWDTSSVTDMTSMFSNASELTTIYAGNSWITDNVTASDNMFSDCTKLVGGAGTTYDSNATDATYARIDGGPSSSSPGYFTSAQNIIFADSNVKSVCVANWDTDHDGELSTAEAAAVTSFGSYYDDPNSLVFADNSDIQYFNELQYFTGLQDIEAFAFAYCENLASVTLPSNIKTIGNQAFQSTNLHSIEIPEGVTTIYGAAFYNCKQLTNVILPSTLLRISTNAFNGCSNLRFITIPESVNEFGNYAFNNCTALTQVHVKWDTPLEIGDADPFPNRANIALYVPVGTEEAYRTAQYWQDFGHIVPIGNIEFADANVKAICVANWDTDGDGELSTVEAASVTNLQGWAKQDIIPGNTYFIRHVGTGQFLTGGNQWGTQISLSEDQTPYIQIRVESLPAEAQAAYPNCYMLRLDGSYTFGTLTRTDTYLFRYGIDDTSIGFVDAPNADVCRYFRIVKNANGHYTIQSAPGLADLNTNGSEYAGGDGPGEPVYFNLSQSSPNIEWDFVSTSPNGFNGTNITSFNELQYFTGLTEIPENTFYSCSDLQSITFPTSITKIGSFAFAGCAALQDLVIPEGVTEIDAFAFRDYTGLVTLPTTVTSIGSYAFENCSGLKVSWTTPPAANGLLNNDQFGQEHADPKKPLYVPLGSYDAYDIPYWWRFDIREYGIITFADANVKAICVGNWDTDHDGELSAEEAQAVQSWHLYEVFMNNTDITSFNELQYFTGLDYIPESAFNSCTNLSSITLPRTLTEIKGGAFCGCKALTSIDIPEGVTSIGESALADCFNLAEISLPSTLMTIGIWAFTNTAIKRLDIPYSVTSMDDVFANSSNTPVLKSVIAPWWEPIAITENTFPQRRQATLFVPEGQEEVYRNAPYWQDFGAIVVPIYFSDPVVKAICVANWDTNGDGELTKAEAEAVTTLGTAFKGNTEIQTFNELQYFTGLEDGSEWHNHILTFEAFQGCTNLVAVTLPPNITRIHNRAFMGCSSLQYVYGMPDAVTVLGDATFSGCSSLTSINLPASLLMINTNLFYGCSSLRWINIPEGVTYYGDEAFAGCSALTKVTVNNPTPATGSNINNDPFPTRADITLVVPPHTSDAYSTATYWQEFKNFQEQEPAWLTYTDENGDIYQYEPGYSAQLYYYADKSGRTTFVMPESITVDGVTYPVTAIARLYSGYLQSLTIPASVTTVKDEAFSCLIVPDQGFTLKEIRMLGSEPPAAGSFMSWANSLVMYNHEMQHQFPDDPSKQVSFKDILLEVPAGTKADYQAANLWKEFTVKENEAYAHVSADGTTLTFYYDELKATRDGHVYPLNEEYDLPQWTSNAWNNSIQTVVFNTSFAKARPTTTAKWFVNMEQLTTITGLENLNTSEVTNMMQMFSYCKQLTTLDLSTLNTEKVQTMYGMFMGCENLTSLNLSNFNTAAVFDMSRMFTLCTRLSTLDISSFNTANVTLITNMFSLCELLMTIYVGNGWSTANVDKSNLNNYCDMFLGDNILEGGAETRYMDYGWSTEFNDDIEYARVDAPGAPGYLTFKANFVQGDVNGDGSVTIADVTALVNIILGKTQAPASGVADVNGDQATTIADVTALVNIILGKN